MDDEKYYETVAEELRENRINDGLWTKAIAKSMGDENKTKAIYIQLRVEQLMHEERRARIAGPDAPDGMPHDDGERPREHRSQGLSPAGWIVSIILIAVIFVVVKKYVLPKL